MKYTIRISGDDIIVEDYNLPHRGDIINYQDNEYIVKSIIWSPTLLKGIGSGIHGKYPVVVLEELLGKRINEISKMFKT